MLNEKFVLKKKHFLETDLEERIKRRQNLQKTLDQDEQKNWITEL